MSERETESEPERSESESAGSKSDPTPSSADIEATSESAPSSSLPSPPTPPKRSDEEVDSSEVDPRLFALENPLIANDWQSICDMLGPPEHAEDLPPVLALIYATARREIGDEQSGTQSNFLAIRSVAELLKVPKDSAIALVLAKRLLRGRPAPSWRSAQAPPARTSTVIILLTLVIGAAVGWLLGPGASLG